jgi:penicillin amidase
MPVEFDMLNYEPEPWQPKDCVLIARMMAWELNFSWWVDLTYAEIQAKVSPEKFREIIPTMPDSIPPITGGTPAGSNNSHYGAIVTKVKAPTSDESTEERNTGMRLPRRSLRRPPRNDRPLLGAIRRDSFEVASVNRIMDEEREYREFFHLGGFSGASNAWVVSGAKSSTGKPLLANDPHLRFTAPARWYEANLSAPAANGKPAWNVAGVTIPGAPVVVIGHNDSLGWGLTNAMLDDADFYIEHADSAKPKTIHFKDRLLPISEHTEIIRIGKRDSMEFTVRSTFHGPIVNDVNPALLHSTSQSSTLIALRWTGFEMSDELYAMYKMNTASNHTEFEDGLKEFSAPSQCMVYADHDGNIGFWMTGRVPIRSKGNPMLPLQGWTGDAEWQGFVPFDKLPKSWNPPDGVLFCANQRVAPASYPYYLTDYYESTSRAERIGELLSSGRASTLNAAASREIFSADDFKQFQMDVLSPYNRAMTKQILEAYPNDSSIENESVRTALDYFHNWDFRSGPDDIATTIFNMFFLKLIHNTFADEMGEDVLHDFVFFSAIPYRVTSQLMAADSSAWFDDVNTPKIETKRDIIHKSMRDALADLQQRFGAEPKNWRWGALHQAVFEHPFGKRKPLDKVFDVGPFPAAGTATTVNKGDFSLNTPFNLTSGPSMRQILDFAHPQSAYMVLPLGQSGQAMNAHYADQTALWLNGGYVTVVTDWEVIENAGMSRLELVPAK